ncbi:MAG: hypothetical protein IH940_06815 [Acidobacteria bacterium]|nr:hypothetical protein [Acidobacteriota bacterium]
MTIAERRGLNRCLEPILLDHVVDDPEGVRELARLNGPYVFPERPGGFIWPTWHTQWATGGGLLLDDAADLLHHDGFVAAAAQMCGSDDVVPEGVYVNIGTPWIAQPVKHTDLPMFRGIDHDAVPGWFLQAMGTSRLFEAERINSITAVAWFFAGANGGFTYWPDGAGSDGREQVSMWNTAIVGDNDFMYHRVERIGAADTTSPAEMTADTTIDHDGDSWVVVDDGAILGRFDDREVRLSVSWKATVLDGNNAETTLDEAYERMATEIGVDIVAGHPDRLFDETSRLQLMKRWPGFMPV